MTREYRRWGGLARLARVAVAVGQRDHPARRAASASLGGDLHRRPLKSRYEASSPSLHRSLMNEDGRKTRRSRQHP